MPYVGEIRIFAGSFAPAGWMMCDGQLLPISENEVLFQLIGTTFGGDGEETFALPDIQGRFPIHMGTAPSGTNYQLGEKAGLESVTLNVNQIPNHNHLPNTNSAGGADTPLNNVWGKSTTGKPYSNVGVPLVNMSATTVAGNGGSQPHDNMHPFMTLTYIISLFGAFPSQT